MSIFVAPIPWLTNLAAAVGLLVGTETLEASREEREEEEDAEWEDAEGENDSGDQPESKPRLSKRQCGHMDHVDMRTNGRYLPNGKCAYDQDSLTNIGNYPEDKRLPRQTRQHHDNDEGMAPIQSSARLARYFSESTLGPLIQKLSGHKVQPPSLAPASLVDAVDLAGEASQPPINSSPGKAFDSGLELKGLLFNGHPDPAYVAVASTANTSTSSVEGLESFFRGTCEGFALGLPLILVALLLRIFILDRANKQRRAARIEHELVGPYPSPEVNTKGDLESGNV